MTHETTALSTREGCRQLADRLLAAVEPYTSPGGARVELPGPSSASGRWSDGLEGFARTFLLAAFRVRGEEGRGSDALLERFARGLRAGTDPGSPERWPTIAERRQAVVEAASVAISLSETRPWLWDRLDEGTRSRTVDWLSGIVGTAGYTNNWTWFQTVIETFLRSVGGPWSQADLDRNLEIQEDLYIADGWYSDGASPAGTKQSFDYYAGWAWHVYPLLTARIEGMPLAEPYAARLRAFVPEALELISHDGAPVLQGRSPTYRFALLAPLWTAAIAGVTPLAPGRTRDLAARTVAHFVDRGALDDRDLLTIGWHGAFPALRQPYTSGGSTYWGASKGLLGLLLPGDHPEWTTPAPAPDAPADRTRLLVAPGWIVSSTAADGIVRLYNHGSDGWRHTAGGARADNPLYHRVGYSNVTSPELSRTAIAAPLESHTALLDARGEPSHRDAIERVHLSGTVAVSRSRVHWLDGPDSPVAADAAVHASLRRGPVLTVASVVREARELRLAWWTPPVDEPFPLAARDADSAWPLDEGPWRIRVGGWALPVAGDAWYAGRARVVRGDGVTSSVDDVVGLDAATTTRRVGSNPFAETSVTPALESTAAVPAGRVVAALVTLSGAALPPLSCRLEAQPGGIGVVWSDGRRDLVPADDAVRL